MSSGTQGQTDEVLTPTNFRTDVLRNYKMSIELARLNERGLMLRDLLYFGVDVVGNQETHSFSDLDARVLSIDFVLSGREPAV